MIWKLQSLLIRFFRSLGVADILYRIVKGFSDLGDKNPLITRRRAYLKKLCGDKIQGGPFKGMTFQPSGGRESEATLLGVYEKEIYPALERIFTLPLDRLINVGAAEGYYAVGTALRMPGIRVTAFEGEKHSQEALKKTAAANGVADRIDLRGLCDAKLLGEELAASNRPFVLMDVEGYEFEILDPVLVPGLKKALILAELHDSFFTHFGKDRLLVDRFSATHQIDRYWAIPRTAGDIPDFVPVKNSWADRHILWERPVRHFSWLVLTPKN